tara:strand:- start:359 stop:517 length:159 start_codon:yes stop_codon:yes gene_type:complete
MEDQNKQAISHFVKSVLETANEVTMQNTKVEMLAYIESMRSEIKTIQYIINL